MPIDHVAVWLPDEAALDRVRQFYEEHFAARGGAVYRSARRAGFVSCFVAFPAAEGEARVRLELMTAPGLAPAPRGEAAGYAHVAIALGSRAAVDAAVKRLRAAGVPVELGPRETGDGYYEAVVRDPGGNVVEVMA